MNQPTNTAQPRKAAAANKLVSEDVQISSSHGQVDKDIVTISQAQQEVRWFAHGSEQATIVFTGPQGSPFTANTFTVPAGGSVASGAATNNVQYQFHYKYTVVGPDGPNDPEVIIVR